MHHRSRRVSTGISHGIKFLKQPFVIRILQYLEINDYICFLKSSKKFYNMSHKLNTSLLKINNSNITNPNYYYYYCLNKTIDKITDIEIFDAYDTSYGTKNILMIDLLEYNMDKNTIKLTIVLSKYYRHYPKYRIGHNYRIDLIGNNPISITVLYTNLHTIDNIMTRDNLYYKINVSLSLDQLFKEKKGSYTFLNNTMLSISVGLIAIVIWYCLMYYLMLVMKDFAID